MRIIVLCSAVLLINACGPTSPSGSDEETPAEVAFSGQLDVPDPDMKLNVEGDQAVVTSFGAFYIGNPDVFDARDPFLKKLQHAGFNHWKGEMANLVLEDSPTSPRKWPTSVSYAPVDITWNPGESEWEVSGSEVVIFNETGDFDGVYEQAGGCETSFINHQGLRLYLCKYPMVECTTSDGVDRHFWVGVDCPELGYEYPSPNSFDHEWIDEANSNVTPGEHGFWGDKSAGGGGTGGTGGTGGGDGGTTGGTTWKDTWRFVQSDKAVQYRLGLVRKDGTKVHFKVQYRVNSADGIYCAQCGGYHVYGNVNADYYRVNFPSNFVLPQIYEMSQEFVVDVQPPATFDEQTMQIDLTYGFVVPYSCADDNSSSSRCSSWDPNVTLGRFTAVDNADP